jgi:multisubunit Na+/H+ antiporter MnhE subunit
MKNFLFNIGLAVVWCSLTANFSAWNFVAGMVVGAVVIEVYTLTSPGADYLGNGVRLLRFLLYFLGLLVKSNLQVTRAIFKPSLLAPRIVRYPVKGMSAVERTTLASAITLTPGTLTIDESPDGEWLYVHAMFGRDPAEVRRDIDDLRAKLRWGVFS